MLRGQDPDRELWQRAQQGDEAAFDHLRRTYRSLVDVEIRKRLCGVGYEDREDIAQEIWLAVWCSLPRFRGDAAFCTWVVGIAKNVIFEWRRHQKSTEQSVVCASHEMVCDEAAWESRLLENLTVHEAVKRLPKNERAVIHLHFFQQLTDEELAQRLGLPLGTAKSQIRAALRKLRASLHREHEPK